MNLTGSIVSKEYLRRCLVCNIIRTDMELQNCPHCYKNYLFFIKSENKIEVHKNRHNHIDYFSSVLN